MGRFLEWVIPLTLVTLSCGLDQSVQGLDVPFDESFPRAPAMLEILNALGNRHP